MGSHPGRKCGGQFWSHHFQSRESFVKPASLTQNSKYPQFPHLSFSISQSPIGALLLRFLEKFSDTVPSDRCHHLLVIRDIFLIPQLAARVRSWAKLLASLRHPSPAGQRICQPGVITNGCDRGVVTREDSR